MNDIVTPSVSVTPEARQLPWRSHRARQIRAVMRLELRKSFLGRRSYGKIALALSPVIIALIRLFHPNLAADQIEEATGFFSILFQVYALRLALVLTCLAIFGDMIRREVLDRTLHYYFLAPIRREVLVVAKYLTGVLVSVPLFGVSTLAAFTVAYLPHEGVQAFLFNGPGLGHLGSYLLVTVLACIGYGSVFLLFGSFFRSPAIPALAVMGWESIHFLLPPLLKKFSVIHYLQSLCPVPMSEGPFAILSDAPSPWLSIPGLLLLSGAFVAISAWRIRGMEVSYEEE
ncbi:MAG TPA: ABC transporter permease [Thermoanaerobaculia bacterium]|nr:ABC transporter permease [Thermoanaerobaculia bacterium]